MDGHWSRICPRGVAGGASYGSNRSPSRPSNRPETRASYVAQNRSRDRHRVTLEHGSFSDQINRNGATTFVTDWLSEIQVPKPEVSEWVELYADRQRVSPKAKGKTTQFVRSLFYISMLGSSGAERSRTLDLCIANAAAYPQLSYGLMGAFNSSFCLARLKSIGTSSSHSGSF